MGIFTAALFQSALSFIIATASSLHHNFNSSFNQPQHTFSSPSRLEIHIAAPPT